MLISTILCFFIDYIPMLIKRKTYNIISYKLILIIETFLPIKNPDFVILKTSYNSNLKFLIIQIKEYTKFHKVTHTL